MTFFWRFGLTGSIIALTLMLIQAAGKPIVETVRTGFFASPRTSGPAGRPVDTVTDLN